MKTKNGGQLSKRVPQQLPAVALRNEVADFTARGNAELIIDCQPPITISHKRRVTGNVRMLLVE
jgi:hypothetical protein